MTLLGTTSGPVFDTGAPWAGENGALLRIYAVSALLPDGSESFLTDFIENNDRDHDGLRDSDEAAHGHESGSGRYRRRRPDRQRRTGPW